MPALSCEWQQRPVAALAQGECAAVWDRLNAQRQGLPFLTAQAVSCAIKILGDGRESLFVCSAGAEIVAMLVAVPGGRLGWRTFQPSQLPLGAFVAAAGWPVHALVESLWRGPLRGSLMLSLTRLDPWVAPREVETAASSLVDYVATAWIDIEGPFDAYWSARGKNLRQNMRKQRTRLAAQGVEVHMRTWTEAAEMAAAVERYGALESAGWKGSEGSAVHPDNAQGRFYRELLERSADEGDAVVYEGLFDERTVAMNLCLRRGATLTVLKTSYDESVPAVSPAFLLHEDMLRAIFDSGAIRRVEYYGRVMDWHTRWTDNRRMLYHVTAFRWPILKRLARWRAARRRPDPGAAEATALEPGREAAA
jgi:CelD/BcsL family acetyltransferase involved in cellulose biosynthesis